MAWIESHTVLLRHRKTIELAFDLNVKPVQVLGHLHALWHAVLEQQEDGDLSRWSDALIAQSAAWEGDATEFVTHLRARGWLDGSLIHDWIDYTGLYLIKKYSSGNVQRLKDIWGKHGYKYGKGNGKYAKQKANGKRTNSEPQESIPNLTRPDLTNRTKQEGTPRVSVDGFSEVWTAYPRKVGKQPAKKAWEKLNGSKPPVDVIIQAIEKQKQTEQWQKDGGKFIPHLSTWLNQHRWEDEVVTVMENQQKPPPPPPKIDPIARGLWRRQYGDPRKYGYE